MRVIIIGVGAVGAVVGALLSEAGHSVAFWVRPGRRSALGQLSAQRVGGGTVEIAPRCLSVGDVVPSSDWVLICVRGEQLDAALHDVVQHMGAERRVAIAAVSMQSVTEQAHRAGLTGPAFALHASFGSFADPKRPSHFRWYPFDLPTTVTPDGVRERFADARALAVALSRAGLPTRARRSMTGLMRYLVAVNSVMALGWDLCNWELPRLAKDRDLRRATSRAMHESTRIALPPRSLFRLLPAIAFDWFLRLLPLLMGLRGREVWRHHGPKIRPQTEDVARRLLQDASSEGLPMAALEQLFERWRAKYGADCEI